MRCDTASTQLKTYLDGELPGWAAFRVRRHLRRCPDCAAQLDCWRQMNALLLSNDLLAAPVLPLLAAQTVSKGRTPMNLKLLTGVTATAAVTFALLLLPGRGRHTMSMASEIRQAVSQVNTWHLKGWKMQGKNKIVWEVWGRRAPFFYREQVGQDVIVDDGTQRVSIFTPLHPGNQDVSPGIVLKMPSLSDSTNVRWSYQRMVAQWNGNLRPESQTADEWTFNFPESGVFSGGDFDTGTDLLYTVDKQSRLPVRYEARLGKINAKHTISLLNADYNTPISTGHAAITAMPKSYKVYDGTQNPPPQENAVTAKGVTVQATPLLLTRDGLVLLRIKTWFGGAPVATSGMLYSYDPLHIDVFPRRWRGRMSANVPANSDDQRRAYAEVAWDTLNSSNAEPGSRLILLAPAEPLAEDAPPPTELALGLDVTTNMQTRLSGTLGLGDDQMSRQDMDVKVALPPPGAPSAQSLLAYLDPQRMKRDIYSDGRENLTAAIDYGRALLYGTEIDSRNPDRPHLTRSVYYHERFLLESSCPVMTRLDRYWTAQLYATLGDKPRARALLQRTLTETQQETQRQSATDPALNKLPALTRKQIQSEACNALNRARKDAQEALATWAR